jgi:hypothetical protein
MSPASRLLGLLIGLVCVFAVFAGEAVSEPACSADVCVLNVFAANLILSPCAGYSVLVAYSTSSGATLIQCSKPSAASENKAFIYDRHDSKPKPFEFLGGRFIRPDGFDEFKTDGVPDKFGPVPLCAATNRKTPAAGQLLIAEKQPNNSHSAPYCYRINYVEARPGGLTIRSDQGMELAPLPDNVAIKWTRMIENLSPYIKAAAGQAAK